MMVWKVYSGGMAWFWVELEEVGILVQPCRVVGVWLGTVAKL